jgi:hypothetical protein
LRETIKTGKRKRGKLKKKEERRKYKRGKDAMLS